MNKKETFSDIELEASLSDAFRLIDHAAHCLLWFKQIDEQKQVTSGQSSKDECSKERPGEGYGLLQMRSDGLIGFPGGYVSCSLFKFFR